MMDEGEERQDMAEINATPLIDVLLVLLIMVMITLPPSPNLIGLGLAASSRPEAPPQVVRLSVGDDGAFSWNGERLAGMEQLEASLETVSHSPSSAEIHLDAGAMARYGTVAAAMAAMERHGIHRMALDQRPD